MGEVPVRARKEFSSALDRSISAAWAAVERFTRAGEQARQKWNIQGAILSA